MIETLFSGELDTATSETAHPNEFSMSLPATCIAWNSKMKDKKLIVVLGMHRSGTSALTRGLQVLGIELGDHLMPAVEKNNEKGFFEDFEIVYFNEDLFKAVGNSWSGLSPITEADYTKLRNEKYVHRACELLEKKISPNHVFGLKDPRISKLLPFWKEVFSACAADVRYLVAIRNPLSVEQSLKARDALPDFVIHGLWLSHTLYALNDADVQRRGMVVDYDRLLDSPDRELHRIADRLALTIDAAALEEYTSAFLDHKLRHTTHTKIDVDAISHRPSLIRDVYSLALDLSADALSLDEKNTQATIQQFADQYKNLELEFLEKLKFRKNHALHRSFSWNETSAGWTSSGNYNGWNTLFQRPR